MPDYIVLKEAPPIYTAANPKAAIAMALDGMDDYKDAEGSYTATLWVDVSNGANVEATVTVNETRSLSVTVVQ